MKAGGWPAIASTYLFGVLAVATLAKIVPLRLEFEHIVGATPAQYAWLIALLALPAALSAAVSGALVDRVGPRVTLIASGCIGIVADGLDWAAPTIGVFQVARLVEGLSLVGIFTAGPALLMATTSGRRRTTTMTFWSTYTPTGFSTGLLLGGAFAGTPSWRLTFVCHAVLLAIVTLIAFGLPSVERAPPAQTSALGRFRELIGAYRPGPAVLLGVIFFMVISVGFGVSIILPSYIARAHDITLTQASNLIAGTNLSMIAGAFAIALLLARGMHPRIAMVILGVGASACGLAVFWPRTPFGALAPILCGWFLFMGGGPALLLAVLPRVAEPARRGAAAGLLSQFSAIATFVNPPLWLALFAAGDWRPIALAIGALWLVGTVLLSALSSIREPEVMTAA